MPARPLAVFLVAAGAQIGRGAASAAGNILGLEAELNGENYEFEGAKNFVRMAADALQTAATAPPNIDPADIPGVAVTAAAERHAPGLLESAEEIPTPSSRRRLRPLGSRRTQTSSS